MTIMEIIRARGCTHDEARTYKGVVFIQSTCDDCGEISITPREFGPKAD